MQNADVTASQILAVNLVDVTIMHTNMDPQAHVYTMFTQSLTRIAIWSIIICQIVLQSRNALLLNLQSSMLCLGPRRRKTETALNSTCSAIHLLQGSAQDQDLID